MNTCSSQGNITEQYRHCTVHYTPAHWEKFYYLWLHLISSHLGSGTQWCLLLSQSEASIGAADQWEARVQVYSCHPCWCLAPVAATSSSVSPGPRSRLQRLAQPGPAQEARSLFWCPRLSWRWGSEDWISSPHLTRPQHFRSIIHHKVIINTIPCEKNSVSGWCRLMTIDVN